MSVYKQLALVLPAALFWRMVDDDDFELILYIMDIVQFYSSSVYTLAGAKAIISKQAFAGSLSTRH